MKKSSSNPHIHVPAGRPWAFAAALGGATDADGGTGGTDDDVTACLAVVLFVLAGAAKEGFGRLLNRSSSSLSKSGNTGALKLLGFDLVVVVAVVVAGFGVGLLCCMTCVTCVM